jgi:hypothetical protein
MMKFPGLILVLLTAFAAPLFAQVEVNVVMEQTQFLPGESIQVAVRVRNRSGQTLKFGKEDWLTYFVEGKDGTIVTKNDDPPMGHDFEVPTSKVATQNSDLQPYFPILKTGVYTVTAIVHLKDWDMDITSDPQTFDIIRGVPLWQTRFGMPHSSANGEPPEVRKYILQKATYLQHLRLYLRVTDETEARTYKVLPVGTMVSFSQLITLLDQKNNLNLLYEEGARTFNFTKVNPEGELQVRQSYYVTDTAPRLKLNDNGQVVIVGGVRKSSSTDFPPEKTTADVTPTPAPTPVPVAVPTPAPAKSTNNVTTPKR